MPIFVLAHPIRMNQLTCDVVGMEAVFIVGTTAMGASVYTE